MLAPTPVSLSLPVTGYTACKEVLIEGPLTCQPVSACLSDCSAAVWKETVHGGENFVSMKQLAPSSAQ